MPTNHAQNKGPAEAQTRRDQNPRAYSNSANTSSTLPEITEFRAYSSNTLRGIFSLATTFGWEVHGLTLHIADDGREWIGLPSKPRVQNGEQVIYCGRPVFDKVIEIHDRAKRDAFQAACLAALREHPQAGKCWRGGR